MNKQMAIHYAAPGLCILANNLGQVIMQYDYNLTQDEQIKHMLHA